MKVELRRFTAVAAIMKAALRNLRADVSLMNARASDWPFVMTDGIREFVGISGRDYPSGYGVASPSVGLNKSKMLI